jgi:two-component system KDP operon response regulator KdpE
VNTKILVIDDDPDLTLLLKVQLERQNYQVVTASDGAEGLRQAYREHPGLVILDIMMPGMDGWEVCQRLREISQVPIIMLTARGMEQDVVRGLEAGADDYLVKPFDAEELAARIQSVLRRGDRGPARSPAVFYTNRQLSIDFDDRAVRVRGERVDLTPIEFRLLSCLVRNEGQVLSHERLLQEVWGLDDQDNADYVKLYVRYLRSKIEDDPSDPTYIQTVWGVGYYFSEAQ